MAGTISTTITAGYTLSVNPTTIAPTGAVTAASSAALYGPSTTAWSVINQGSVHADTGAGILFSNGGTVSNQAGAQIYGATAGVSVAGAAGYVTNAGGIQGSRATYDSPGVLLAAGGAVTNAPHGSIGGYSGVSVAGAAGTVVNDAFIDGAHHFGVKLAAGGLVSNASTGFIYGYLAGISLTTAGTVLNAGNVGAGDFGNAVLMDGGLLDNAAGGYLNAVVHTGAAVVMGGIGTVLNAGTISDVAPGAPIGLFIAPGGSLSNAAGGVIRATDFAVYSSGAVSVTNSGTIASLGASLANPTGVLVQGFVSNAAGGTISGARGVYLQQGAGDTLLNDGFIQAVGNNGVQLESAALVSNASGGVISGYTDGIFSEFGAGVTVMNQGTITATGTAGFGVQAEANATIDNAGGSISGLTGVELHKGGTVVNAGTIAAIGTGDAVSFVAGYASRLVVDPGAAFTGTVDGGNSIGSSIVSTLELAGTAAGTLAGIGTAITNFAAIAFNPGATWDVSGVLAGFAGSVAGFAPGDAIRLTDVVANSGTYAAGSLNLYDDGTAVGHIAMTGSFAGDKFTINSTTGITVACFLEGTCVLTEAGEVEVERLRPGMRAASLVHRRLLPIAWIGRRRLRAAAQPRPHEVWPVRVRAGAFGPGLPHRDLVLSPDHAVIVDGVLIPVRYLVNGVTIAQQRRDEVSYYHVELAAHGVLLAEGLPAESYLDTGNRAAFAEQLAAGRPLNPACARSDDGDALLAVIE